jgi:hypothetical protein
MAYGKNLGLCRYDVGSALFVFMFAMPMCLSPLLRGFAVGTDVFVDKVYLAWPWSWSYSHMTHARKGVRPQRRLT